MQLHLSRKISARWRSPVNFLGLAMALALILCVTAMPIRAQIFQPQIPQVQVDPANPDQPENTSGVYPRDSAIAIDRLTLARHMEQLKEWNKSADLYQEILEKYPDRVVPVHLVAGEQPIQYTSVTEAVRQALSKWPPDGLDVYRGRYEATAANIVSSAGPTDLIKLHEAFSLYFPTDAAKTAGIRMMDSYFESGDYTAAIQVGRRLLDWHPNLAVQRPMVLFRTALAEKLSGDAPSAGAYLIELTQKFPQATGMVKGDDVILADALKQELASGSPVVGAPAGDSWLTFGGDESRDRVSTSTVRPGARLYSVKLSEVSWKWEGDPTQRQRLEAQDRAQRDQGAGLGVMPVVDRGELFFQDNVSIYGVGLDSGLPLPGWAETYPNDGFYKLPGAGLALPAWQQFCLTLSDKYVTGIMNLSDTVSPIGTNGVSPVEPQLVLLDRRTGRQIWKTSMRSVPDDKSALRSIKISGSPLIVGDSVYVVGYDFKGQQFQDCYLLCFDIADGKCRWGHEIVSAAVGIPVFNADGQPVFSNPVSHIAYAGGRLFVVTSLGAAAALNAYDGAVIWLDIFRTESPQIAMFRFRGGGMMQNAMPGVPVSSPAWSHTPAIVQNGKLFVLPDDGDCIFIYDAGTGQELKRIWLSDFIESDDSSKPDVLLAVRGELMYLGGPKRVWRLPWEKYNHDKEAGQKPSGYWASASASKESPIRGRAFVTGDAVYMPTRDALWRIVLKSGNIDSIDGTFPRNQWDREYEGPGNIVVTKDHIIVAGDAHVAVYTNLDVAKTKLDAEVAAATTDPAPRLHYSEVMFAAGQNDMAEDKLNEAFKLLGGTGNLHPGPVRDRAFNDALGFTARLGDADRPSEQARLIRMFDLAAAAAQSASQQVAYRVGRAKYDRDQNQFVPAVELYQQILSSDEMRLVSLPDPDAGTASQARIVAEQAIDKIIKEAPGGKQAYAKFEEAAVATYARALEAKDADQLLAVSHIYPNSQIARQATLAAAQAYEAGGNPRQATLVLRQILSSNHEQDRAMVLEALARNYLTMKNLEVAAARLMSAGKAAPEARLHQPLNLPDGTVLNDMTLLEAGNSLGRFVAKIGTPAIPDLHLPVYAQANLYKQMNGKPLKDPFLPETAQTKIAHADALIVPLAAFSRGDRILTWTRGTGISGYPVDGNAALFTCPDVKNFARGAAWLNSGLLAWSGAAACLIDPQTGKTRWQLDVSGMAPLEVIADASAPAEAAAPPPIAPLPPPQPQIIFRGGRGGRGGFIVQGMRIVNAPMQVAAPVAPPTDDHDDLASSSAEQILQLAPVGDRIVIGTSQGRILAVDSGDGHVVWQTRVSAHGVERLLVNPDFTVVRRQDTSRVEFVVVNSYTGELVGRKSFSGETGGFPVNQVLSPDGMLVYTMPDRLCVIDLFEANLDEHGMEPQISWAAPRENPQLFQNQMQPDQLIVHAGRIFAVTDYGKMVRVFILDSAKPWSYIPRGSPKESDAVLSTNSGDNPNVTLHVSGNYLYVFSPLSLIAYQVEHPDVNWPTLPPQRPQYFDQLLFGRDYLIALGHQRAALAVTNKASGHVGLFCFSRTTSSKPAGNAPPTEPGLRVFDLGFENIDAAAAWQAVDGGIAYGSGGEVHVLLGAREQVPTTMPATTMPN
jgi:outer membrane protein assembly factor BamB